MSAAITAFIVSVLIPLLAKLVPMFIENYITDHDQKVKLQDAFDSFVSEYNKTKVASADGRTTYQRELDQLGKDSQNETNTNKNGDKT